jgi:MFS family permease
MKTKWRVYFIALFSYSTVHAIRTMWSAIKSDLTGPPFDYKVSFLGALDMVVLFVLALFMNLIGPKIEGWGVKRTLIISMIALAILTGIIGFLLDFDFTSPWLYVLFFGVGVGFFSCVGWPCCLWVIMSVYRWFLATSTKTMG